MRQLEAELKSRVSWNQTEEPRQIESNRRAASAGIKPESRVSWNRTGEPRQLESNRRPASAGVKRTHLLGPTRGRPAHGHCGLGSNQTCVVCTHAISSSGWIHVVCDYLPGKNRMPTD